MLPNSKRKLYNELSFIIEFIAALEAKTSNYERNWKKLHKSYKLNFYFVHILYPHLFYKKRGSDNVILQSHPDFKNVV